MTHRPLALAATETDPLPVQPATRAGKAARARSSRDGVERQRERAIGGLEKRADPASRWVALAEAAAILSMDVITLRRACERNARRAVDGVIEANFDGVRARKIGRLWRVALGPGWQIGVDTRG